jgi:hypothetical protein
MIVTFILFNFYPIFSNFIYIYINTHIITHVSSIIQYFILIFSNVYTFINSNYIQI